MRIGHGYDVHRFGEGDFITLGGVRIPHKHGLVAHSDGDVLLHALSDALLGAAALGDIGKLFPDNDDRYLGADSMELLREKQKHLLASVKSKKISVSYHDADVSFIEAILAKARNNIASVVTNNTTTVPRSGCASSNTANTRITPTTLATYMEEIRPQTKSFCSTNNIGPG